MPRPVQTEGLGREFVDTDLARQLERAGVSGIRIHDPEPMQLAGMAAQRIDTDLRAPGFIAHAIYIVAARGYYHYVISLTAPDFLANAYADTFERIVSGAELEQTDDIDTATRRLTNEDIPLRHAALALALAHAGHTSAAWKQLEDGLQRWPQDGALSYVGARLLYEAGVEPKRTCLLAKQAVDNMVWTPELMRLAIDAHIGCGDWDEAARLTTAALEMFPNDPDLRERRDAVGQP